MSGATLYGVGVGPGDPDLLTLRAHRLIRTARVIAYPALPGTPSLARSIVKAFLPPGVEELAIELPMTTDRRPAQAAYDAGAAAIGRHLAAGHDVVMLCEGDPLFYGSFMYLQARLAERFPVVVVPGVSSLGACAAVAGRPLVARSEVLTVLPATLDDAALERAIVAADALAILKVGRHLGRIRALLARTGRDGRAIYVERASMAAERVMPLAQAPDPAPYFSMILVNGEDPWANPPSSSA